MVDGIVPDFVLFLGTKDVQGQIKSSFPKRVKGHVKKNGFQMSIPSL